MSDGKTILVDVSRCTGCRGCQVACKQWNELPATDTVQTGSYQNPPDMNGDTYKIVRFREGRHENGKPYWNFSHDPPDLAVEDRPGVQHQILKVKLRGPPADQRSHGVEDHHIFIRLGIAYRPSFRSILFSH